jgi:glutamate dehydrogenase/leucine dehydrogenase
MVSQPEVFCRIRGSIRNSSAKGMIMETLLQQWNGEQVTIQYDRPTGAWILMAIHSTRLGPPVSGGTRMKTYPDVETALQDAFNLAAAMTTKLALAGIAHGGGKVVIALPPDFDPNLRPDLLRRYGMLLQHLDGFFWTDPDVGTSPADMDTDSSKLLNLPKIP